MNYNSKHIKYYINCILLLGLLLVLHLSFYVSFVACNVTFCVFAALLLVASVFQHISFSSKATFTIVAYTVWLNVEMTIKGDELHIDRGYVFCVCWLLFFALRTLFADISIRNKVVWLMVICAAFEMTIGFAQLFGLLGNGDSVFILGGSFCNPAMFAAYLSLVLPFVFAEYLRNRKNDDNQMKNYVLLGCLVFGVYFVVISFSRSAWIATAIGMGYVVGKQFHLREKIRKILSTHGRRVVAVVACATLLSIAAISLYAIKKDSADGRLLIWKVAILQPNENVLTGGGIGAFEANYCRWQRDYFEGNVGTERERYLADYVTCAYNEFLETYIEQGVVGLSLLLAVLIAALCFKPQRESHIFVAAKGCLWGVVSLFCVSYPTHCGVLYLQLVLIMALIYSHQDYWISNDVMGATIRLILFSIVIFLLAPLWQGYSLYVKGRQRLMIGDVKGSLDLYEQAYPKICNSGIFLFYYGSALNICGEKQKCISILERAQQKSSDANISLLLGNVYKELGDTAKALLAYQNAISYVPSRLLPRYQTTLLLLEAGRREEACHMASELLSVKEKTPTTAGVEMKSEMRRIIDRKY